MPTPALLRFPTSWLLNVALLKAVREGVGGSRPLQGEVNIFFTFYLHINSSIDHVCVQGEKGGQGKSGKKNNWNQWRPTALQFHRRKKRNPNSCLHMAQEELLGAALDGFIRSGLRMFLFITSAKEVVFVSLIVCLALSKITQKVVLSRLSWKFQEMLRMGRGTDDYIFMMFWITILEY